MRNFINRVKELEFLNKKFNSKQAELIILYGRRRIGKTELVLKFCENKEHMYFMGRLESKEDTLKRFNNLLIEKFNDKKLLNSPLHNWDSIFDYINEKSKKRIVLVIDEFPFIADRSPEIISIIQDNWDSKLKDSNIMMILLGSSISMMEKYALDYKSPLYGRRTGQWKIDKMSINHLKDFFPNYNMEDILKIYSCLDSIPGYLTKFSHDKSPYDNIEEKMFTKGEFLYEEIEVLLREEFRDPSNYMSILSSVAGGLTTFNDIYNRTNLDKSLLSKYLNVLENLGIVEKIVPITESYKSKLKAKGALYSLKDNFFNFWFRFVYLNKQELEKGNSKLILNNIKNEIEGYVSRKFEDFAIELLSIADIKEFNKIGKWWDKEKEIDIVALNDSKKEIIFGECKWQNNVETMKLLNELKENANRIKWNLNKRKEVYMLFAKSFNKKVKEFEGNEVYCFDLEDMGRILNIKNL